MDSNAIVVSCLTGFVFSAFTSIRYNCLGNNFQDMLFIRPNHLSDFFDGSIETLRTYVKNFMEPNDRD